MTLEEVQIRIQNLMLEAEKADLYEKICCFCYIPLQRAQQRSPGTCHIMDNNSLVIQPFCL